jgi:hypothetical protein
VVVAILGLVMLWLPESASAHGGDGRAEVVPAQVAPGGRVTVLGTGLSATSTVEVELFTSTGMQQIGAGTTDADGGLMIEVMMPADAVPRYYEMHVTDASGLVLTGYVEVVAPQEDVAGGMDVPAWLTWGGLAAAAAGAAVLAASRRRRAPSTRAGG